jgi:hypothetical protein
LRRTPRWCSTVVALALRAVAWGAGDSVDATLSWPERGGPVYRETLVGHGQLVRHLPGGDRTVALDADAGDLRRWQFKGDEPGGVRLTARSSAGHAVLRLAEGGLVFEREGPWRGFRFLVDARGAMLESEVLESAATDSPDAAEPPVDLDLGEVFTALELGLLPPRAVNVGDTWHLPPESPATEAPATEAPAMGPPPPMTVTGCLLGVEGSGTERTALYETHLEVTLAPRATPLAGLAVRGTARLTARHRFALGAGRTEEARGPMTLALHYGYADARGAVADVTLDLDVAARRVDEDTLGPEQPAR